MGLCLEQLPVVIGLQHFGLNASAEVVVVA
jgi:hypothetical protein